MKGTLHSPKTLYANVPRGFICNSQTWKQARCHSAGAWCVSQRRPPGNTAQPWKERDRDGQMCMSLKCVVRVEETRLKSLHGIRGIWRSGTGKMIETGHKWVFARAGGGGRSGVQRAWNFWVMHLSCVMFVAKVMWVCNEDEFHYGALYPTKTQDV